MALYSRHPVHSSRFCGMDSARMKHASRIAVVELNDTRPQSNPINIMERSISYLLRLTDSFFLCERNLHLLICFWVVSQSVLLHLVSFSYSWFFMSISAWAPPLFVVAHHLLWKLAIRLTLPRNIVHIATIVSVSLLSSSLFVSHFHIFLGPHILFSCTSPHFQFGDCVCCDERGRFILSMRGVLGSSSDASSSLRSLSADLMCT